MRKPGTAYYYSKAKQSFESKLRLYLFELAIKDQISFNIDLFKDFSISRESDLLSLYINEYWQYEGDYLLKGDKSISDIYKAMQELKSHCKSQIAQAKQNYIENFELVYPRTEFDKLLARRDQAHCHYCDISPTQIEQLANEKKLHKKNERGWQLELDRKRPNEEYTPVNCVWACYWCNNAKSDEFTAEEFKQVGEAIKAIWKEREHDTMSEA